MPQFCFNCFEALNPGVNQEVAIQIATLQAERGFLDETLALRGYIGCALMFVGMLIAQLWPRKAGASH